MTEHPIFTRARGRTWLKMAMLALLPLSLGVAISRQASWKPRVLAASRADVFQVAFSPDNKYLAVASRSDEYVNDAGSERGSSFRRKFDDAVDVWDESGQVLLHRLRLPGQSLGSVAFSLDGRELAGVASWPESDKPRPGGDNTVKVWDVSTGQLKRTLKVEGYLAHRLYWTPKALTFSSRNGMQQWDARTGKSLGSLMGDDDEAALSPDGKTLAVGENSYLRDIEGNETLGLRPSPQPSTSLLTFSRDGSLLAGCQESGGRSTIKVWDIHGAQKQALRVSASPHTLAISPDNSAIATGEQDNTIRLWSVSNGALLRTLKGHVPQTLAFSPDGATLACGSANGTFSLWRVK